MIYVFGDFVLDTDCRELRRGTVLVGTEPQTFDLLLHLIQNRQRVVSKDGLLAAVWNGRIVSESTLSSQIAAVRSAIGDSGERQDLVRTFARKGFRFVGEVQERCGDAKIDLVTDGTDGAKQPLNDASGPERRQLSVMVCKLADIDFRSSRDPESLLELVSACHGKIKEVIAAHDGFIAKSLGDEIVVYFGYPRAREDDAERAVLAGLAAIKSVGTVGKLPQKSPQLRVGVAAGLAVVGDFQDLGFTADHTAIGGALPLAAELAACAAPGTLVISAGVHRLLGDLFNYGEPGSLSVRSSVEPIKTWRVLGESATASRFEALHSKPLKLLGRQEELVLLQRRWRQARTGEGRVVLIYGEPGIGKSRLVYALRETLKSGAHHCLRFQCSPHRTRTALHPVIGELEHAAGFAAGDDDAVKIGKLEALFGALLQGPGNDAALFADLLCLGRQAESPFLSTSPQRRKELIIERFIERIASLAAGKPILIEFEDAHWIDPTSLELFDILVDRIRTLPVLLIVTYRPEFAPPWLGQSHVTALTLNKLGRRDNAALIRSVAKAELPSCLLEQIISRTDGIPLFVEEMTKSVLESNIVREQDGAYVLAEGSPVLSVPGTLQASLAARLDRLSHLRTVVQAGAALGREFSYPLLRAVCNLSDAELNPMLDQLVASELVRRRGTAPHAMYTFKHALVQEAAYATMLKGQRQQMHARIVEVFEGEAREMLERNPDVLAHHCTEAGAFVKAIGFWLRSARMSLDRSAAAEAHAHVERAMGLLSQIEDDATRRQLEGRVQNALGDTLIQTRGFASPEVAAALLKARELIDESIHPLEGLRALWGLFNYRLMRSESMESLRLLEPYLQRQNDRLGATIVHHLSGTACLHIGKFRDAVFHLEKALSLYDETACRPIGMLSHHIQSFSLIWLSLAYLYLGEIERATEAIAAAIKDARSRSHPFTLVSALLAEARFRIHARDPRAAIAAIDEGLAIATEQRSPYHVSRANILRAVTFIEIGNAKEGIALMQQALAAHRKTGANFQSGFNLSCLAKAYAGTGDRDRALDYADEAIKEVERTGDCWWAAEAHRIRGEILLKLAPNNRLQAESCFQAARTCARGQDAKLWELRAAYDLANLRSSENRNKEARTVLLSVYRGFPDGVDLPDLKDAGQLLSRLG
ncbi:AAA family ATPase [Bradyrhizobium ivorense]|uniref:AAA family ATPase n=1 Tax=Bradyrhizobium ivorense TaxID=2511166 RepID=UPI0010B90414|nr:AAA family ATPase [Bradyrhizobium ivorense]VIO71705.1 Adenylate cyclase 1 [Bradyrhizobium ivorense]